jgi:hypothetical protein
VFIPNPQTYDSLTYLAQKGRRERLTFWPGSVLGNLRKLCKALTKAHPWDVDQATWFVLTGDAPLVRPIQAKINSSWMLGRRALTTISLNVQPWVPAETVENVYRQVQSRVLGGENKRIGDKSLRLLEFVTQRAEADGELPSGRALVEQWDQIWIHEKPQWCYGADTRTFWRDLRNAQRSVTNSKRAGLFLDAGAYEPDEYMPEIIG